MPRTADDWIDHAAGLTPPEAAECLDEALAAFSGAWDLRRLLTRAVDLVPNAWDDHRAWLLRGAEVLRMAALAEPDLWPFRTVAGIRDRLGDRAGALAALREGVAAHRGRAGYNFVILAKGFAELDDDTGLRACLDAADPKRLDDVCALAVGRAELLGEVGRARKMLAALAPADAHEAWTLGNAWQTLDPGARSRVFETALVAANTVPAAIAVARAFASHDLADGRDRALERAASVAAGAAELIDVAEGAFDLDRPDLTRAALEQAEAAADVDRDRLGAAWRWIDPDRANGIAPPGVRPDALRPLVRELVGFEASAEVLVDHLRARLSDEDLRTIASADYGDSFPKHLAALTTVRDTGCLPRALPWEPGEVVRLTRWGEGATVDHAIRAFCAAILCVTAEGLGNDAPILAESVLSLGEPAVAAAQSLFAWLYATSPDGDVDDQLAALWALALLSDERRDELADAAEVVIRMGGSAAGVVAWTLREALWHELTARELGGDSPANARWRALLAPGDSPT